MFCFRVKHSLENCHVLISPKLGYMRCNKIEVTGCYNYKYRIVLSSFSQANIEGRYTNMQTELYIEMAAIQF